MKILFALPGFHRYDRGAEVALLAVATHLARAGHEVTVAGMGDRPVRSAYAYWKVPAIPREWWERFPKIPPLRSETAWEDAGFAAGLLLRDLASFDLTVTCSFPFSHWALRSRGRRGPAHVFVTQNGDWPAFSDEAEYRTFRCDGLVCTNPDYFERNRQRWRSALIPNGIDLARFKEGEGSAKPPELPAGRPIVLMVSALIDSKRVADGVRAVARLDGAALVVAGDGPLRHEVVQLAERLLPGRFGLVKVPADQMPALYRAADVFLHLSLLESFGNVFLEASACGLPVVAHDSPRLRWILGDDQFLCDSTDTSQLHSALTSALARSGTPPEIDLERYSWPRVSDRYIEFFEEVLKARNQTKGLK